MRTAWPVWEFHHNQIIHPGRRVRPTISDLWLPFPGIVYCLYYTSESTCLLLPGNSICTSLSIEIWQKNTITELILSPFKTLKSLKAMCMLFRTCICFLLGFLSRTSQACVLCCQPRPSCRHRGFSTRYVTIIFTWSLSPNSVTIWQLFASQQPRANQWTLASCIWTIRLLYYMMKLFFVGVSILVQKKVGQVTKPTKRGNPTYTRQKWLGNMHGIKARAWKPLLAVTIAWQVVQIIDCFAVTRARVT